VRIALLGATEIEGVAASVTRRDGIVLGALVVSGDEALSAEQLAAALWGDDPPKSAQKVIQGAIVRLRRLLGADAIETTGDGYRLLLDGNTIDTHLFENSVARARELAAVHEPERAARAYGQALSLWRGAPLPDLQDWDPGRAETARLTEIRRAAEEELVEVRMDCGRTVEAVAEARHLVTREPFREHRWALLALALYRGGRQREALDVLRRARTTLRDELGLDPGPELVALETQILQQDPALLDVPDAPSMVSPVCPYPGLRPFDTDQSEFFVGRENDVTTCMVRLAEFPLLVVVGASGSGKSSLVRAGVVPALREAGRSVVVLSPGASPVASLTSVLASAAPPDVVVVDQLEELFTAVHAADTDPFLRRLTSLTEDGTLVVVTLRADYMGELSVHPGFARLAERGLLLLTPMTESDLRRAIAEPARRSGLLLEPGLVDLLVRDVVGEAGGLPLMSHALAETWAHRDGNVLTVEGYTRTGGIRGAVALSAERLYDSLSAEDRTGLRSVLRRLVTPTAGEPVAARVPTRVFAGTADAPRLLDLLVRARLVTTSTDTATIAHESLVRAWPRLRTWLDEDVEGQRVLQHLQVAADGWDTADRPDDELYRGVRLTTAIEWRQRTAPVLSDSEIAFLDASSTHEQDQKRRRRNWIAVAAAAAILVVAVGITLGVTLPKAESASPNPTTTAQFTGPIPFNQFNPALTVRLPHWIVNAETDYAFRGGYGWALPNGGRRVRLFSVDYMYPLGSTEITRPTYTTLVDEWKAIESQGYGSVSDVATTTVGGRAATTMTVTLDQPIDGFVICQDASSPRDGNACAGLSPGQTRHVAIVDNGVKGPPSLFWESSATDTFNKTANDAVAAEFAAWLATVHYQ
jgi:DNA-binding SARP family transcriptional activator